MTDDNTEKRHFARITLDGEGRLQCGDDAWNTRILDLSLKGALVARPAQWRSEPGERCTIEVLLDRDREAVIAMEGRVAHVSDDGIGIRCEYIDLDSISHLKRLVQLNLGDDTLLGRELQELVG